MHALNLIDGRKKTCTFCLLQFAVVKLFNCGKDIMEDNVSIFILSKIYILIQAASVLQFDFILEHLKIFF